MRWLAIVGTLLIVPTFAQDIREHHEHESIQGRFYATWMRPPARQWSCCNKKDCRALGAGEVKNLHGLWYIKNLTGQWLQVPTELIEQNRPDPRESPDGRTHACHSEWTVFCFTLGAEG